MKVLFLLKNFNKSGGVERITERLAYELESIGHDVKICVMNNDCLSPSIKSVNFEKTSYACLIGNLRKYIKYEGIDLVISAKEQSNLATFIASFGLDVRKIYVRHSAIGKKIGLIYSFFVIIFYWLLLLNFKSRVGVVSNELLDNLKKALPIFRKKIVYLPNAVLDNKFFNDSDVALPEDVISKIEGSIITVGRLIKSKKVIDIIEAYNLLCKKQKAPNLIIIGDGPELDRLKNRVCELGLDNKVFFYGYVSNPYPFMKAASIFVMSSEIEGMPTVIIEALALNKIVISSDCKTGPRELLKGGKFGYLYPVGDVNALTIRLQQALGKNQFDYDEISKYIRMFQSKNSALRYLDAFRNEK